MNDSMELKLLRTEMLNMIGNMRRDLDRTTGELLATRMVLHAVIASHPDRARVYDATSTFDTNFKSRAAKTSPECEDGYKNAWYDLRDVLMAAPSELK